MRLSTYITAAALVLVASFGFSTLPEAERTYQAAQDPTVASPLATTTAASYNWSGYVAESVRARDLYTSVSGTWTVPAISVHAGPLGANATWVGIGGSKSEDLIQAGTQGLVDSDGNVEYQAWFERLPEPSVPVPLRVAAGDSVSVSLAQVRGGLWHITFINNTTGDRYSFNTIYDSSLSSAQWVEEMPTLARDGSFIPLASYDAVSFTGGYTVKNGIAMTIGAAGGKPLHMTNFRGQALASPTVLGGDGASFTVLRSEALATPRPARIRAVESQPYVIIIR